MDEQPTQPAPTKADSLTDRYRSFSPRDRRILIITVAVTVGGLALLCLFAILLLRSDGDDGTAQATETPGIDGELPAGEDSILVQAVSNSGTISLTVETPVFLNIAGQEYGVESEVVSELGDWPLNAPNDNAAVWVYGSVINYVFGLADSDENQALIDSLILGDEMVLTTRGGTTYTFAFSSRELVDQDNRDVFAQHSPGLTVVLVDGDSGEQQMVVRGRYTVSDAQDDPQIGRVVELGETTQLEDLQIMATSVTYLIDRPEVPPGFAFFLVDYQVENVGSKGVDTSLLNMVLADELGNLYALNATAAQLGNNRQLSGSITSGQRVLATAGYQIPAGLNSPVLRWQVTRGDSGASIEVSVPFRDQAASGSQAQVQVNQGEVSLDGTSVLLIGQLTNLGEQPLVVSVSDVTFRSDGTVYLMLSTNPAFPWTIAPGQQMAFSVTFQRPAGSAATLQILNQPFQITGLR